MQLYLSNLGAVDMPEGTAVWQIAEKAFPKKASLCVGAFINKNPKISDLRTPLKEGDKVDMVFIPSEPALEVIRHSSAHVMAQAVQELWPEIKVTIGPVIENGFYYDFDTPKPFLPADLEKIETKMKEIIKRDLKVIKEIWPKEKAIAFFKEIKESYKVEIIEDLEEQAVSIYKQGEWLDLCKGPHVQNFSQIGAVKVLRQSGAYWRGDENKPQLQRVYGTAFHTEKDLRKYLKNLKEAEKRDHRKLGKEMGLFYFSDLSPGTPFFTGAGAVVYNELKNFLKEKYMEYGYQEVITPQIFHTKLFEQSGHTKHFAENMYPVLQKSVQIEQQSRLQADNVSYLKPMNCPGHCVLYSFGKKSYRDLPYRIADFGRLHRREKKGVLHGLTRVSAFCQDDAHVFCTLEQMEEEIQSILKMFQGVYAGLGLNEYKIYLSTRPKNFMGEVAMWDQAEKALEKALKTAQIPFAVQEGEGAFYGPKLDMMFVDAMQRSWQLGTLQCDFNMPKAFNLKYTDTDNQEKTPVLLHRAILGSLERFMGVYLEHQAGNLPLWLSPVPLLLLNISKDQEGYVRECAKKAKALGLKVETDLRAEKLGYKIREARFRRIPLMAVAGDREKQANSLAFRSKEGKTKVLPAIEGLEKVRQIVQTRSLNLSAILD